MKKILPLLITGLMIGCTAKKQTVTENYEIWNIHHNKYLITKVDNNKNELPFRISPYYEKKGEIYLEGYYSLKPEKIIPAEKNGLVDELEFVNLNPPSKLKDRITNERVYTETWDEEGLKTIRIFGKDYFYPPVNLENRKEKGKLNFYLIPVENHTQELTSRRSLIIRNEDKIYRGVREIQ